jgi:hypothetical protein
VEPISISPFTTIDNDDDIEMRIARARDLEVLQKNYRPRPIDRAGARAYFATTEGVVLRLGGVPVGVAAVLSTPWPGDGVVVPIGSAELEIWVLPSVRGQGPRWFTPVLSWVAERHDQLVGVAWADSYGAIEMLHRVGWQSIGRSYWRDENVSGECKVFQLDPRRWRTRSGT